MYVVWSDNSLGNFEIFYRRSTDGGATFAPVETLSTNGGISDEAAITAFGNNVYLVWNDDTLDNNEILYKRSTDGGDTFDDTPTNLSTSSSASAHPDLSAIENNVYVVWVESTNGVFFRRSTNDGASFDPGSLNLNDDPLRTISSSRAVSISASGDNVYVVWVWASGFIFFKTSATSGLTFERAVVLNSRSSTQPTIASVSS